MKRLLFFVVAAATILCGCKKDDNGPKTPVADLNLPVSSAENPIAAGSPVTIQGKGFTRSSEIWLRALTKAAETDVQATVTAVTDASITFTAPAVSGEQGIILKQEGDEWNLGTMFFTSANEILPRKLVRLVKTHSEEGEADESETQEFTYDEQGRIIKITESSTEDDSPSITGIQYTENGITVQDGNGAKTVYSLKDGRTVSSEWTDAQSDYTERIATTYAYDANGFLCEIVEKSYGAGNENPYTYTSKRTFQNHSLLQIIGTSENRNEYVDITPNESLRNNLGFNLCTYLIVEAIDHDENVMPYQLGITGNRSIYLPEQCVSTYEIRGEDETRGTYACTFDYTTDNDGYIHEIRMERTDNWSTIYQLFYEE